MVGRCRREGCSEHTLMHTHTVHVGDPAKSEAPRTGKRSNVQLQRANSNMERKGELEKKTGNYGGKGGNEDRPDAERFQLGPYGQHLRRKTKVEIGI